MTSRLSAAQASLLRVRYASCVFRLVIAFAYQLSVPGLVPGTLLESVSESVLAKRDASVREEQVMQITNTELADLLNSEFGFVGRNAITANVVRQWVDWDVLPRAQAQGQRVGNAPSWARSDSDVRKARRLAELRRMGLKRENALVVQTYIEWGHQDFDRVRVAFAAEWRKASSQLARRQSTFLNDRTFTEVSAASKKAIANQLGPLDHRLQGTRFEQSQEFYAVMAEIGRSGANSKLPSDELIAKALDHMAPRVSPLLNPLWIEAIGKVLSGIAGLPDEIENSGIEAIQNANKRDFRVARYHVRLFRKAVKGQLPNRDIQSALESEPTFQKLRELGPQILNVPWVILPFIQALKYEIPN